MKKIIWILALLLLLTVPAFATTTEPTSPAQAPAPTAPQVTETVTMLGNMYQYNAATSEYVATIFADSNGVLLTGDVQFLSDGKSRHLDWIGQNKKLKDPNDVKEYRALVNSIDRGQITAVVIVLLVVLGGAAIVWYILKREQSLHPLTAKDVKKAIDARKKVEK